MDDGLAIYKFCIGHHFLIVAFAVWFFATTLKMQDKFTLCSVCVRYELYESNLYMIFFCLCLVNDTHPKYYFSIFSKQVWRVTNFFPALRFGSQHLHKTFVNLHKKTLLNPVLHNRFYVKNQWPLRFLITASLIFFINNDK